MESMQAELALLGAHLSGRQDAILRAWQGAIKRDPKLTTGDALPRVQLLDHIPAVLALFVRELRRGTAPSDDPAVSAEHAGEPADRSRIAALAPGIRSARGDA